MNLRPLIVRPSPRARRAILHELHISRHDHTHPQVPRNHRSSGAGGGVVADGNGGGADALARGLRAGAGHLLCRGRHRLGAAGDADHRWMARPEARRSRSRCCGRYRRKVPPTDRAWRAAIAVVRPANPRRRPCSWCGPRSEPRPVSPKQRSRSRLPRPSQHAAGEERAIAERICEMPDIAAERDLSHRPAHRDLARRIGLLQVGQHRIVHRRASNRDVAIGRQLSQIVPVHRGLARQLKVDRVACAEILDQQRSDGRPERAHPALRNA